MATWLLRPWPRSHQSRPTSLNRFRARPRMARPALEPLEERLVLNAPTIPLNPYNDEFGAQIQTVTQFGDPNRITLGILDTGASPITVSPDDQASFAGAYGNPDPIPVKVAGGASAQGIGGSITGDVSKPVTVLTDGLHAGSLSLDFNTFNFSITASFTASSARTKGVQAFIGTYDGSPDLPTVSGTPIFAGGFNSTSTSKLAAKVDLINGVDFYGIGYLEPDIHFVPASSKLTPQSGEQLATIPLTRLGTSNMANPGNEISSYYNYVANTVQLNDNGYSLTNQKFLLDTGSELTVISTAEAQALHINLSQPFDSIQVQGVGGIETVNGYVLSSLKVGLTGGGTLTFTNVPVFVLDAAPGQIAGILGMNLFDNVDEMLIDPFTPTGLTTTPTVSLTWNPSYTGGGGGGLFYVNELLYGRQGPPTLHELLGGAARDFHPPTAVEATPAAPSSAAATPAATTAIPPIVLASTALAQPGAPAASALAASVAAPPQMTSNLISASAPLAAGSPNTPWVSTGEMTAQTMPFTVTMLAAEPSRGPGFPTSAAAALRANALGASGQAEPGEVAVEEATIPAIDALPTMPELDILPFPMPAPAATTTAEVGAALAPAAAVLDAFFAETCWTRAVADAVSPARSEEKVEVAAKAALLAVLGMVASSPWGADAGARRSRRGLALRVS